MTNQPFILITRPQGGRYYHLWREYGLHSFAYYKSKDRAIRRAQKELRREEKKRQYRDDLAQKYQAESFEVTL